VIELSADRLVFSQPPGFRQDITADVRSALNAATGRQWTVERREGDGLPTLVEREQAAADAKLDAMRQAPLMQAVLAAFPGAEQINEEEVAPYQRGARNWSQRR
jgi:DNA polymerase-3 subunit gamma/tau